MAKGMVRCERVSVLPRPVAEPLSALLAAVAAALDADAVSTLALSSATTALAAPVAVMARDGLLMTEGLDPDAVPAALLRPGRGAVEVDGVGPSAYVVASVSGSGTLAVARPVDDPFTADEEEHLRCTASAVGLRFELFRLVSEERELRRSLQERHVLLERLTRIQRAISARAPLPEVLDSITEGAVELLGDEVSGVRLRDPDDHAWCLLVSNVGLAPDVVAVLRRTPVEQGVGGRALLEDRLIVEERYGENAAALQPLVRGGLQAAMAAPVHEDGRPVGSLVATYRPDRRYSADEQEVLLAFAEQASLALNAAKTLDELRVAYDVALDRATHDDLTGLANRARVLSELTAALAAGGTSPVAVLFVDLDHFKAVNDTLGHGAGDEVLVRMAERLWAVVCPSDVVARLSGDEFVVVRTGAEHVGTIEELAAAVAAALEVPVEVAGRELVITASIGIARVGSGACAGVPAEQLVGDADVAMYRAKERGRARVELFDAELRSIRLERLEVEHDLRRAVELGQLRVHYQPTVELATGRPLAVEALVRWQHPVRGLLPPSAFVPMAEELGLVAALGEAVLRRACIDVATLRATPGLGSLQVAVNLSARQLGDPRLVAAVTSALEDADLDPDALWLEITESSLVDDAGSSREVLEGLGSLGVHLAIDDFGTGYSSLTYLKRFPVDVLKIDRSFVDGLPHDAEDQAIVVAVLGLARAFGLGVVAEGVETAEQAAELERLGCEQAQGYLFARPAPLDVVHAWLREAVR